jgi:hypothetical protein
LEDQENGRSRKNTNCKNSQGARRVKVKVIKKRTTGTLKLTAIVSRRMREQAGDWKMMMEGALVG